MKSVTTAGERRDSDDYHLDRVVTDSTLNDKVFFLTLHCRCCFQLKAFPTIHGPGALEMQIAKVRFEQNPI